MIELLIETGFRNLLEYSGGIIGWMRQSKTKCDDKVGGSPKKSKKESDESDDKKKKSDGADESDESDDKKEKSDEADESDESDDKKKSKKSEESEDSEDSDDTQDSGKSGKSRNMYDLSSNFETLVYDNKKYKHELKTGDVIVKGTVVGKYNGDKISSAPDYCLVFRIFG